MPRNRALTEQRLIDAVGQLITEVGIEGVRINRVARRAGVNKILIYRYFGDITTLREAYFSQSEPVDTLPSLDVEALMQGPLDVFFEAFCEYVIAEYRLLRKNPKAQARLKASLTNYNNTPALPVSATPHQYQALIDKLSVALSTKYGRPYMALINSGMTVLTLLSQQPGMDTAFGFDLSTDTAWDELETALRGLFRGSYLFTKERLEQEARQADSMVGQPAYLS